MVAEGMCVVQCKAAHGRCVEVGVAWWGGMSELSPAGRRCFFCLLLEAGVKEACLWPRPCCDMLWYRGIVYICHRCCRR